jgi:hypothetical protein
MKLHMSLKTIIYTDTIVIWHFIYQVLDGYIPILLKLKVVDQSYLNAFTGLIRDAL